MKKNDKLVVVLGVIILIIASIGIFYWSEEPETVVALREDVINASGKLKHDLPEAVKISDSNAFYPLIVTPLTVHYSGTGEDVIKKICPLYIENFTDPSSAVERLQEDNLDIYDVKKIDYENPKEMSLDIAKKYWKSSDAVLLIKNDQEGYRLGVPATPMASYLSIPVIVTDDVCQEVTDVLEDLGVEISIICGDLEGHGKNYIIDDTDEIINLTVDIINDKLEVEVGYITITNPDDAYPPKVLNTKTEHFEGSLHSANFIPSNIINLLTKKEEFTFTIPDDFKSKYVRVTLEVISDEPFEEVEMFGDTIGVMGSLTGYISSAGTPPLEDEYGHPTNDRFFYEETFYDMGGEEFHVALKGNFMKKRTEDYTASVTFEELEHPISPLMEQVSSMAPYLTAHHQGIIFSDHNFGFANDDHVKFKGQNKPGAATPRKNPEIIPALNEHIYNNIHKPLNELLAKLTHINISNLKALKQHCYEHPFYISILGDATMLPQYFYRNPHSDPYGFLRTTYGTNTPSDFIYGNVDPADFSLGPFPEEHVENDKFITGSNEEYYPAMENIVGRITGGFDVQDTSAMIARTVFYDDVINSLNKEWKDSAVVMSGAGLEFQAVPGIDWLYRISGSADPMKFPTGQQHFLSFRTSSVIEDTGEFNVEVLERGQASRAGFSKEALNQIKRESGLLNMLLFPKRYIQYLQGLENIKSLFNLEWWNTACDDESGIHGEEAQESSNLITVNAHGIFFDYNPADVMMYSSGGPLLLWTLLGRVKPGVAMRTGLESIAAFDVRAVAHMEMGPSVMFVECCGGGKIDSLHPENTLVGAYTHAGLNAFVCPSTLSAISGYLEPKNFRLGLGISQYIKTNKMMKNNQYIHTEFCGWIFEETHTAMARDDIDIGLALRNARNGFIPDQIDITYLWTPPLEEGKYIQPVYMKSTADGGNNVPVEKYAAVYQLNLIGDPAFNPYQPVNEG